MRLLLLRSKIKTANAPKAEPIKAPRTLNPKNTRIIPHSALIKSSIPPVYDNMPNNSIEVNKPLNIPVKLQRKSVKAMGKNKNKLSILINLPMRGENKIGARPTMSATEKPSFMENLLTSANSLPVALPVTPILAIAQLKMFTGLDKAIMKAYRTLNSA